MEVCDQSILTVLQTQCEAQRKWWNMVALGPIRILFLYLFLALSTQRKRSFWWNMGFRTLASV